MCKSQAEGGARCQAHTRQAVSDQMVSYAAAVTPVNSGQAHEAIIAMEIEGAHLEAPTREEVDLWLNQTIQQVRFEPTLTEPRRERIIRRLREGLGKVLPSGATFHAWKNIMAEAWQRSRRKAAVFFVAGVLTFSGGCGFTGGANDNPEDSTVSTSTHAVDYASDATPAIIVPASVRKKYSAEEAQEAYKVGASYVLKHQVEGRKLLMSRNGLDPRDFEQTRRLLSQERQADWDQNLACVATDDKCWANIGALSFVGGDEETMTYVDQKSGKTYPAKIRTDVNPVSNKRLTNPTMILDSAGRLQIEFGAAGKLRYAATDGTNLAAPYANKTILSMIRQDGKWKIDGWKTTWTADTGKFQVER